MNPRWARQLVALCVAPAVLCGAACTSPGPGPGSGTDVPLVAAPDLGTVSDAYRHLARLAVAERVLRGDYERGAFGPAWMDTDGNGCNQRDDVLLRDAVPGTVRVQRQGSCGHDVLAGTWVDPYTGQTLRFDDLKDPLQAQAIQIDHVVPLAEAWSSGASSWPVGRRRQFANDLVDLLAVDGPTNARKSADDPAAWRPRNSAQCAYAVRWIAVKHRWDLAVDDSENRALREMLGYC